MFAPRMSVVMPVFNVEDYIAEAIRSVLGQSFKDFELIVVDDGGNAVQRLDGRLTAGAKQEARAQAEGCNKLRMHYLHALCNRGCLRRGGCVLRCR